MTGQKVQGVVLAAAVAAAAVACAGSSGAEGPQPTVIDSLPPPETNAAASPSAEGGSDSSADLDSPDQDDDGSDTEPTPVPASSEGPAQNWPVPEPPEEIYEATEEGAEALIQYWFDVRHYARITGDTEPWREASHESCEVCDGHMERLSEVFANDGWFVSEPDLVKEIYLDLDSETTAAGYLVLDEAQFEAYWNSEFYGEAIADTLELFSFSLVYEGSHWKMETLTYQEENDSPQSREATLGNPLVMGTE